MAKIPAAYKLKEDYPLLYEISYKADFNEKMGFMNLPLHEEIATAMYELWLARANNPKKESHA